MENLQLNFPFLSSLPFFTATAVAFVCQVVVMVLAFLVGRAHFSLWWVLVGALMWWLAIRSKQRAQNMRRAYDGLRNNDQKFICDRVELLPSWVSFPDQERAEWFNRMLSQLWPFMNKYLQDMIISIMEPAVNGALPALSKVLKFRFEKITMGEEAPRVGGMKVYKENIARGEIVIDAEILYAGDCAITARVGKFLIGFNQITLTGNMRIIMKPLIRQMPFIGGITAFFLSTPAVEFNLTNLADVMDIPGLNELTRKVVQEQLNYFLVLPNKISIPLVPDISKYDLKFIPPDGVLRVFIAEAEELERADIGILGKGKSDPYCIMHVGSQNFRTQVIKENINPNWSEYFEAVVDQASGQFVDIEVYDKDQGNEDDFLGRINVDIYPIAKEGTVDKWFRLEDCKTGNIRLRFYWLGLSPEASMLNTVIRETAMLSERANLSTAILMVFIDSAKSLPNLKKIAAEPHPYCVASVGKAQTYKTTTIKRTFDPAWECQHSFLIHDPRQDTINFSIFDEKTKARLGWYETKIGELLEQKNMDTSGTYALQNSGTNSKIILNLRLRLLRPISLAEAVSAAEKFDANAMPSKAQDQRKKEPTPPLHTGSDGDKAVSAQEFKEQAKNAPEEAMEIPPDVSFPTNLEAESELRQRSGTSAAIKITTRFGVEKRVLILVVHEVVNLSKILTSHPGSNNYYVSLTSVPYKTKRRTAEFHGDPDSQSYEETLEFPIDNELLLKTAYLEVKIKTKSGTFAKDALAQTIVSLEPVIGVSSHTEWYSLETADQK